MVVLGEIQGPRADYHAVPPPLGDEVDQGPLTERREVSPQFSSAIHSGVHRI